MKRMGALLGISALVTLSLAYFFGEVFATVLACVCTLLLIFSCVLKKYRRNKRVKVIFSTAIIFALIFISFTEFYYKPIVYNYSDKELKISAKVEDAPYESFGNYYYYLKTTSIDNEDKSIKILLKSMNDLKAELDDCISFYSKLMVNTNDYYKAKGYYLYGAVDEKDRVLVEKADSHSYRYYPYRLRAILESKVNSYMNDENAGICKAIAFGDKKSVNPNVKEAFSRAGLSHILVVSGLHMSVVSMIILFVLRKIFRKRYVYCPLTILFVLFYMVMTGLSFSIIRSGIMMIIIVAGLMLKEESDPLNSLGIAGLFIVILNPYSAGDIGLLLSFSATLGIILVATPLSKYVIAKLKFSNRIIIFVINIIAVSISAIIFTTPLLIIFFHNISLVQVLANLLVSPVFELLLLVIIFGSILALTGISWLYTPFLFVANGLASYINLVADILGKLPFSYVNADKLYVYVWMGLCLVMTLCIILIKNYKKTVPLVGLVCVLVLLIGIVTDYFLNYNRCILKVYDCGNGITATVTHKGKSVALSCGGDFDYNSTDALMDTGESYNLLSVTDRTKNRNRYFDEFSEVFDLGSVLIYDNSVDLTKNNNSKTTVFRKNYKAIVGEMKIEFIVNNNKVFTYLTCNGKTLLILPRYGDCTNLDKNYRSADVVIADSPNKNDKLISANLLILSCDEESFPEIWSRIHINSNRLYTTYNGDFSSKLEVW
ncbi:MAG: ComEC/Rec2 family competence protein [Oscillospiraceae bacterium]|nr:ComEC/Rec2 family competence protein [Oscillospiraceae bacterium]